jgi:transposase-like protein
MTTESTLIDIAIHLKEDFEARETALQRELQELDARQTAIRAELRLAADANDRFVRYQPGSSGDYKCPYCWMRREQRHPVYPIGGGTRNEDYFRCSECNEEITVRF